MNIAAYVAACEVTDLDYYAKDALRSVCGRADYPDAVAEVSVARLAADMGVHYDTARRALHRAVKAGYLAVDKQGPAVPRWHIKLAVLGREHVRGVFAAQTANNSFNRLDIEGGAAAPPSPGGSAGDNTPRHAPTCQCQGTGWVWLEDGTVTRCHTLEGRSTP